MKNQYFKPTIDIHNWVLFSSICEGTGTPMSGGGDTSGSGEAPARQLYI